MNPVRPVSVTAAVERAAATTKRVLFDGFSLGKWLALGFCAFLVQLGQGGGGGSFPTNLGKRHGDPTRELQRAAEWVMGHLPLVLWIGGGIFCVAFALGVLFNWLSSRGEFMFLDGVVKNRGAVEEPWFQFRRLGNSLFLFRLLFGLAVLTVFAATLALCWVVARPSIASWRFDGSPLGALFLGLLVIVPVSLASLVVSLLLRDFVVPIMYRREVGTLGAFRAVTAEVLSPHLGAVVFFYVLKLLLAIGAGIVIFVGTCLTCCIAALPYISSVVFLPIAVFFRAYSLHLLEQLGDGWTFFGGGEAGGSDGEQAGRTTDGTAAEVAGEALPPPEAT